MLNLLNLLNFNYPNKSNNYMRQEKKKNHENFVDLFL